MFYRKNYCKAKDCKMGWNMFWSSSFFYESVFSRDVFFQFSWYCSWNFSRKTIYNIVLNIISNILSSNSKPCHLGSKEEIISIWALCIKRMTVWKVNFKSKLSSRRFSKKTNKGICFFWLEELLRSKVKRCLFVFWRI